MSESYQERLEKEIRRYERELAEGEEGVAYIVLNDGQRVRAELFYAYGESNMLVVDGIDDQGQEVLLLLPLLEVQVVLTKVMREVGQARRPIGFETPTASAGRGAGAAQPGSSSQAGSP